MSLTGHGCAAVRGSGAVAGLACVLLTGCATPHDPLPTGVAAAATSDWRNAEYTVTCDGVVPDGLRAAVVGGRARIPADGSRPPHFDYYDVTVIDSALGDVNGDAAPDAVVLLECSPQPSNGIVQEVHVFAATGREIGALPSPRTLTNGAILPPLYEAGGLSVDHHEIVAKMMAYGPGDSHASGPSVPFTVHWRLDGQHFVLVSRS